MHIFLNGLGASTSSGVTYLRNVLPHFADHPNVRVTVAMSSRLRPEFSETNNVSFAEVSDGPGAARRFWFEQTHLPKLLRSLSTDVLISAGNFAVRNSPVPQILLSGNSLYTSTDFYRDLRSRRDYRLWLDTKIKAAFARKSINWADRTVAPTRAFADELQRWAGKNVLAIHHGFDPDVFFADKSPLPARIQNKLDDAKQDLKLLYVSHYNYFRNFETLLRALPLIREQLKERRVKLFLTCRLKPGENPGSYRTESAASLVEKLEVAPEVVELGAMPYSQLHHLYRACDLYVTSSYAETFAHPLVEALACGLPVVAADLPVHREVCGKSAIYFARFSPEELADCVLRVASGAERRPHTFAPERFSWREHVKEMLALADQLVRAPLAA